MMVSENLVKHQFSSKSKMAAKMAASEPTEKKIQAIRWKLPLIKHNQLFPFHGQS